MTPARGGTPPRAASTGRSMTGAMTSFIVQCDNPEKLRFLRQIFDGLTSTQLGTKQAEMLSWVLGLDDQQFHDRDIHQVTNHFSFVSVGFATKTIDDAVRNLCRVAGLTAMSYNDLRRELRTEAEAHKPAGRPLAAPAPTPSPPPNHKLLRLSFSSDDQRSFFKQFLSALSALPDKTQDAVLFLYGMDPDGLVVPRRYGQLVGRSKITSQSEAEDRIASTWRQMHANGLDEEINDKQLRAQLAAMRDGRVTSVPATITPTVTAPANPPAPPTTRPVRTPTRSAGPPIDPATLPTDDDRKYFLERCAQPHDRAALTAIYRDLDMVPAAYRTFFVENYGLRRGHPPVVGTTIAEREGKSNGWLSMVTKPGWQAMRRNGLAADFNGRKLFSLMCQLHNVTIRNGAPREEASTNGHGDERRYQPAGNLPDELKRNLADVATRCAAADRDLIGRLTAALTALSTDDLSFFDQRYSLTTTAVPPTTQSMAPALGLTHGTGISTKLARIWSRLDVAGFKHPSPGRWMLRVMTDIRSDAPEQPDFDLQAESNRLLAKCAATERPVFSGFLELVRQLSRRQQRLVALHYGLFPGHPPKSAAEIRTIFELSGDYIITTELHQIMLELHRLGLATDVSGHTIRGVMSRILDLDAPPAAAPPPSAPAVAQPSQRLHELMRCRTWVTTLDSLPDRALMTALTEGVTGSGPNSVDEISRIFGLDAATVRQRITALLQQYDEWCARATNRKE